MAQAETIRVTGLRETQRALKRVGSEALVEIKGELVALAEPVAADARARLSGYPGIKAASIKPKARIGGAIVQQTARKVTGRRPDFGSLQMRRGLLPALTANEQAIVTGLEHMLDRIAEREGF